MTEPPGSSIPRNTLINLAGALAPAIISLVAVPLYLNLVGQARYGVLAILWVLLGYFGLFDLGMGRAMSHHIARVRHMPQRNTDALFWTALLVNLLLGALGGLLLLFSGNLVLGLIQMPPDLRGEALQTVPWLALSIPVATVSAVLSGALEGREHFFIINTLGAFGNALFQIAPLAVAYLFAPHLMWLVAAVVLSKALVTIVMLVASRRVLSIQGAPRLDRACVGLLIRYGGWISVTTMITPLLTTLDRLIIGARVGVQALVYYTIPQNLVAQMTVIPWSLARSLFPRFSMLAREDAGRLGEQAAVTLAAVLTPGIILALVLLDPLLHLWLGSNFAPSITPVAVILLLGFWFNGIAYIPYTLVQAQGRPDVTAKLHLLELLPYLALLWIGLARAGVQGAAWAWTVRVIVDAVLLYWIVGVRWTILRRLLPAIALLLLTVGGALTLFDRPELRLLLGTTLVAASVAWSWSIASEPLKLLITRSLQLRSSLWQAVTRGSQ
jgi:O-antigen/teichoic acid export membrane protein